MASTCKPFQMTNNDNDNDKGPWKPPICAKQMELLGRQDRYLLVNGPRQSGKSVAALHMLCWRAWRFESLTSVVTNTTTSGVDGGVWDLLVNTIIPQWIEADFGFEWVRRPYKQASTQKHKCSIRNMWGTISVFELDSLDKEADAEKKFKGRNFQTIFVSELSNFKLRSSLDSWIQCLRLPPGAKGMTDKDLQLISDTNPSDEGEDSWIYQIWYVLKNSELPPGHPEIPMQKDLGLMEFQIADNPYLTQPQLDRLYAQYSYDANLKARYLDGLWVKANASGLFASVYKPLIHCVGSLPSAADPTPEMLVPETNCSLLATGWDPGNRNLACAIVEPWYQDIEAPNEPTGWKKRICFKILDEVVLIKEMPRIEDFTQAVLDKMDFWQTQVGYQVRWEHYSDKSAWTWSSKADRLEHQIIFDASGGRIELIRFDNVPGTVAPRVRLFKRLLFEERLLINNARCPRVCEMFSSIRAGAAGEQSIELGSEYKHVLDALSYVIFPMCSDEVETSAFRPNMARAKAEKPLIFEMR